MQIETTPAKAGPHFIYDERFGYTYFASEAERDATFNAAQYIDQKHWWIGHVDDRVLRAWPK